MSKPADLESEAFFKDALDRGAIRIQANGRVFKLVSDTWTEKAKPKETNSYRQLWLFDPAVGRKRAIYVHRLQWIARNGVPEDPTLQVNHKDGDKRNCSVRNLELVTKSRNRQHAYDTGLQSGCGGERHGASVATDAAVNFWTNKFLRRLASVSDISLALGCTSQTVKSFLTGHTYSYLDRSDKQRTKIAELLDREKSVNLKRASHSGVLAARTVTSSMTDAQVRKFRRQHRKGLVTQKQISIEVGVARSVVSLMLAGKTYKHVPL